MLDAQDGEGMLDGSATPVERTATEYASLGPDALVGAFRVERLIGRGGMGEVYLAHREGADFAQRVAIKMLRPEAVGHAQLFGSERNLLARLEHPAIARLIDGGVAPDGRPYMALEYVEGREIHTWCVAEMADLATRLHLFLGLCDAVEYAHARLVLHLDIKPSNILVDGEGRPRLLDFGVARIIEAASSDRTITQALLTPEYAAPEQFNGGIPTVATDVYALGAVLFGLLAGRGPWQFDNAPLPTVLRRLFQDDPPYPSRVAVDGGVPAARISGDLDAIVMKAMRRNPTERYSAVGMLAADVRHFLAIEPVEARVGTNAYRARRFLRRNRWAAGAAAIALLVLLVGTGGVAWQARQTRIERDIARAEAERSEAVNQTMLTMFNDASDAGRADTTNAREMIDHTAGRLVKSLDPDSPKSAAVIGTLSDLYTIVENYDGVQRLLETALARGIGRNDPVATAKLKLKLAPVYVASQRFPEARALLSQADRVWRTDPQRFRVERAEAIGSEASMLRLEGNRDAGIALLQANMPEAEEALADNSRDLGIRYANLTLHLIEANRLVEAEALLNRAAARLTRNGGQAETPVTLQLMQMRGGIKSRRGDLAGAAKIFRHTADLRRSLYGPSMGLASDLTQLGSVLNRLNQPVIALAALDEALPMANHYGKAQSQPVLMISVFRADALTRLDRLDEAAQALAMATPGIVAAGPAGLPNALRLLVVAKLHLKRGNIAASRAALNNAGGIFEKIGPTAAIYSKAILSIRSELDRKASGPNK